MNRLDQTCRLPVGTRDAVHVPIVVAKAKFDINDRIFEFSPGAYVKFIDDEFTTFVTCEKDEAHGVMNPFLEKIYIFDPVIIMLLPGITGPVRHHFDIDPSRRELEKQFLQDELKASMEADPECAGCYHIRNNEVGRS